MHAERKDTVAGPACNELHALLEKAQRAVDLPAGRQGLAGGVFALRSLGEGGSRRDAGPMNQSPVGATEGQA